MKNISSQEMQKVLFITGGSKGIGKALLHKFLCNGFFCVNFSRSSSQINNENLKEVYVDLSDNQGFLNEFQKNISQIDITNCKQLILINNAGLINPIDYVGYLTSKKILDSFSVNLTSPVLLTNSFLKNFQDKNMEKYIVNISSGAANYAIQSWSIYCSAKASLDMFSKVLNEEQQFRAFPFKVITFYPGKVDTSMQSTIRDVPKDRFKDVDIFKQAKIEGKLLTPKYVSNQIFDSIFDSTNIELIRRVV